MTKCIRKILVGGVFFGHVKSAVIQKWCSVLIWTHEILAGGVPNSTHKNTPYRLDKLRSALAEAQLIKRYWSRRILYATNCEWEIQSNINWKRMHCSWMRTTRSNGHLGGGGLGEGVEFLWVGICLWVQVYIPLGIHPPTHCMLGYRPPFCGENEWHTLVKTLPSCNYCCMR